MIQDPHIKSGIFSPLLMVTGRYSTLQHVTDHYRSLLLIPSFSTNAPYLDVPVRVDDEVSCVRKFAFVSGICHLGSLHSLVITLPLLEMMCVVLAALK